MYLFLSLLSLLLQVYCSYRNKPKKAEAKSEPEKKEAVVAAAPATDLTDDTELVAVISAAIAASEGTTTEGFVVRSINRR